MSRLVIALALAALYLGALGSVAAGDLFAGLVLGATLARLSTPSGALGGTREVLLRVLHLPRFVLGIVVEVLKGSWLMARVIVGRRDWRRQGIVPVEMGERSSFGVTVSSVVFGLSPGSFVVDLDQEARTMLVHVLDASDPEGVRRQARRFYERYQAPVFP